MNTKNCTACRNRLSLTEFYKNPYYKDGLTKICKLCTLKYDRERVAKHPGPLTTGTKKCTSCKNKLDVSNFTKRLRSKDGLRNRCKKCDRYANKKYRNKNPNQRSLARIRQVYGLSEEQYLKLLKNQDYKCKICGKLTKLVIDHCHLNINVRGLLCSNCNAGLGMFEDNVYFLEEAIKYLKDNNDKS